MRSQVTDIRSTGVRGVATAPQHRLSPAPPSSAPPSSAPPSPAPPSSAAAEPSAVAIPRGPLRAAGTPPPPRSNPLLDDATREVCRGNTVIGFIRQVGRVFVALAGNRFDLAEEAGQFPSWDRAEAALRSEASPAVSVRPRPDQRFRSVQRADRDSARPEKSRGTKAGDLLIFRPRARRDFVTTGHESAVTKPPEAIIRHGGREFRTTRARAESFLAWARAVVDSGQAALVPLAHDDGVDLLLITGNTPLEIGH